MSDSTSSNANPIDAFEPLKSGPDHIRRIIEKVLKLEQERLYQRQPHLNDDVVRIIKEQVI